MRIARFLLVVSALMVVSLSAVSMGAETSDPVKVSGSYWYVVDHITQVDDNARVRVWLSMPGTRPGQDVTIRNISPQPTEILVDDVHGNRVAYWDVTPAPEDEILFFHYDFDASLSTVSTEIDPDVLEPYNKKSDLYRRYTAAGDMIRIDDEIEDAALRIVGEELHPYYRAKMLFDWMVENLEFVPGGTVDRNTTGTLKSRQGDCGQFSRLYTAMCRSLGIPTRTVTSYWLTGGLHRLAEVYLPPYGWVPADISTAQVMVPNHTLFTREEARLFVKERKIPVMNPDWLFGNVATSQLVVTVGNDLELPSTTGVETRIFATLEPGGDLASPLALNIEGLGDAYVPGGFLNWGPVLDVQQAHDMTHQKLAARYLSKGLYDVAEEGCLQMQASDPDATTSWINLGLVNLRKGLYNKAEACFNSALRARASGRYEKFESAIWAHNYLGNCYDLMGRRELAMKQYAEVVALDNDYRDAMKYARLYQTQPFTKADFN